MVPVNHIMAGMQRAVMGICEQRRTTTITHHQCTLALQQSCLGYSKKVTTFED